MIAKKQPKSTQYTKSRAQDVGDLCRYILDARTHVTSRLTSGAEPEKVICSGSFGLNFKSRDAQISEMSGLAAQARSGNPVDHWIVAWPPEERPTESQLHEAARLFISEMGMDGHQVIYGAHGNTDSIHLHFAINRVDPETERVVKINRGFDRLAAQKAICSIAHKQGWLQVEGIKYEMTPTGPQLKPHSPRGLSDAARAAERSTAMPSLERRAKALAPTIAAATSWQDLHQRLAAHGATYEKRKGGAVIKFGKSGFIKASKADRTASLAVLEKRFGHPFERPVKLAPKPYEPAPPALRRDLDPVSLILALIFRLLGFHRAARTILYTKQELERAELRQAKFHSAQAKWAAQSVLREEHAAARRELKTVQDAELAAVKAMTSEQALAFCKQHNLFPADTQKQTALAPAAGAEKEELMNKHLQNFEVVHAALGATRYRLIAKDEAAAPGETPRHFTHGKKAAGPAGLTETGAFVGWTPGEVRTHMHEVVEAAEKDRYGTYVTPLSVGTHYILIDDINSPEKLEKSRAYAAALEVESSPGNRQKVLKIKADPDPTLAKKAANATAARINAECGDPAVRNGEQAWRMPGFANNKPKHRQPDGSAPEVVILSARGGYCSQAQHIYNEEVDRLRELQHQQPAPQPQQAAPAVHGDMPTSEKNHRGIPWTDLYREHGTDLAKKIKGLASRSLDYAMACRLRAMGYPDGQAVRILAHGREWTETVRRGTTPMGTWDQEVARVREIVRAAYNTPDGDRDSGRLGPNAIKSANRVESDYARALRAQQPAPEQQPEKPARRRSRGRSR